MTPAGDVTDAIDLVPGERVKLSATKRLWNVRARGDRYIILTQPFNPRRSFIYTVIDLNRGIRGPHNSYGHPITTEEEIATAIAALESGEIEISRRRAVTLDIEWVIDS